MSIGETLTAAREGAKLSVDQVAKATRIPRTLVQAIERDDFSRCGGDVYARGHIRTIARTVGAQPGPLLEAFDSGHRPTAAPRISDVFESETATRAERRGPNWSAVMAGALVLVVGYGIVAAVTGDDDRRAGQGVDGAAAPAAGGSPSPSSAAGPSGGPSAVAQAPRDRVTVALDATDRSWVQASTASGKQLFQGLLLPGQHKTFIDRRRVKLVVGNAGGVRLTVNGTDVGVPGRLGQVARVQFTPEDPEAG